MKYTIKQRLEIAKEHVDNGIPLHELEKKYDYHASHIKYSCELYRRYGDKAFENRGESRTYTRELKLKVINEILTTGKSCRQASLDLMLTDHKIVEDWVRKYKNEGESAIKDTHSRSHYLLYEERLDTEANKKLLERLEYLEAENEYLKKSYALIQKRKQQQKKKH